MTPNGLQDMARGAPPQEGQQGAPRSELSPAEELDADIAFGVMASLLYSPEGSKIVSGALRGKNPAPALGMFISSAMEKVNKQMEERGMPLSPNAWLSEGGAVDRLMDSVAELGGMSGAQVTPQLESMVMAEVIDQMKLMSATAKKGAQAGSANAAPSPMGPPPPPGGATPPQGMDAGMPPQGMPPPAGPMGGEF
jgi:hypothetical protein